MLTLAVTSSTAAVGVAVGTAGAEPGDVVHHHLETDRRHSEELTPLVQAALADAGAAVGDLELLAADIGPGRFTGLRVGLATVRTLALAAELPVVGLTSREVLAAAEQERPLLAVIDARRAEVFQQRFDADGPADDAVVGRPEDLAPAAVGCLVVGDGADRYAELYGEGVRPGRLPSAAVMVGLASAAAARPGPEVVPSYLRDPDVNVNVKTRHTPR
ncbi:MAG: tRNA (adenosine(37)-N6)-threonylcarbamoyltransferase complex dimerization subunit type 1 TsaB [Actinomycetota bacterium]